MDNKNIVVFVIGNKDFVNSLNQLKDHYNFTLKTSNDDSFIAIIKPENILIIHEDYLNSKDNLKKLDELKNLKILAITSQSKRNLILNFKHYIELPSSFLEINNLILSLVIKKKFNINSSIKVKDYILDKNEKKLKRNNKDLILTEKEIELIELFIFMKTPILKNEIQKKVWNYSEDADTHTVETHIYRLRKKIRETFKDEKFIQNNKQGYFV